VTVETDLLQPYLTTQLIAYIGNKRALLPFLHQVFLEITDDREHPVFLDPFAGSGSVSRLAKVMGWEVLSNDWEPYAMAVNRCHLEFEKKDLHTAFNKEGGIAKVFRELNAGGNPIQEYIARYYAPENTQSADYRTERLFYTRENGLFIDRMREIIKSRYPREDSIEHSLLLASLIYQAATHANTSGVFKAYHRGFGGFGKDALSRIMKPMALQIPVLVNGSRACRVVCEDALRFTGRYPADICYLDPPYNQHQYGSNYHLLNTIALWDKPIPRAGFAADGRLKDKAGIRKDWKKTKSPFCYRSSAGQAMRNLLASIDSRHIVVSYNTEGIIPFLELFDMLADSGSVSIRTSPYVLYKGGRQSLNRGTYNQEFLFVLDRSSSPAGQTRRSEAKRFLLEREVEALFRSTFHPERVSDFFCEEGERLTYAFSSGKKGIFTTGYGYTISVEPSCFAALDTPELTELASVLQRCRTANRREEATVLTNLLRDGLPAPDIRSFQRRLIRVVRKFAFRKYRPEFKETVAHIRGCIEIGVPGNEVFFRDLAEVERIASLRFDS
jgi:adenine-specific DNA-methyltransferase